MDAILTAIEQSYLASLLRTSRWGYAALNATHIAGIAILVGGILPLDLRLMGFWSTVDRRNLARVLVPTAATGVAMVLVTGLLLFSVRAKEYAGLPLFWAKISIVIVGVTSAILTHLRHGLWLDRRGETNLAHAGLASMACWIAALFTGRLIAFAQ